MLRSLRICGARAPCRARCWWAALPLRRASLFAAGQCLACHGGCCLAGPPWMMSTGEANDTCTQARTGTRQPATDSRINIEDSPSSRQRAVNLASVAAQVLMAPDPADKIRLTRHACKVLHVARPTSRDCLSGGSRRRRRTKGLIPVPSVGVRPQTVSRPLPRFHPSTNAACDMFQATQVCRQPQAHPLLTPSPSAPFSCGDDTVVAATHPARPDRPELVAARCMKRPIGPPLSVYLLHSLAHIELNAIDIFWDTILRWYGDVRVPSRMWVDLLCVALDECTHFEWINARMQELGYGYGDMPAHHGLWEEACESSGSLLDRLIQVPLQQEARALDAQPRLVSKLLSCGDRTSAELVNQICSEEVAHVACGMKWFEQLTRPTPPGSRSHRFRAFVEQQGKPRTKAFNHESRARADMDRSWYAPLEVLRRK